MEWLTVAQIADKLKVNPKTIHRYWERHKEFLEYIEDKPSPLRISEGSLDVLRRMRFFHVDKNLKSEAVKNELRREGFREFIDVVDTQPTPPEDSETEAVDISTVEELLSNSPLIRALQNKIESLETIINQQNMMMKHLMDRDRVRDQEGHEKTQAMLRQVNVLQEAPKEIAISLEPPKEDDDPHVDPKPVEEPLIYYRPKKKNLFIRAWGAFLGKD